MGRWTAYYAEISFILGSMTSLHAKFMKIVFILSIIFLKCKHVQTTKRIKNIQIKVSGVRGETKTE